MQVDDSVKKGSSNRIRKYEKRGQTTVRLLRKSLNICETERERERKKRERGRDQKRSQIIPRTDNSIMIKL